MLDRVSFLKALGIFLIVGLPILAPMNRWFELVSLVGLLCVLAHLSRGFLRPKLVQSAGVLAFAGLFLAFWLPALISSVDALKQSLAVERALGQVRFFALGIAIVLLVEARHFKWAMALTALVISVWAFDAFFEVFTGNDWLNRLQYSHRINGPFEQPKLGYMSALLFLPCIVWFWARNKGAAIVLAGLVSAMVVVSADRGGWLHWFWVLVFPVCVGILIYPRVFCRLIGFGPILLAIVAAAYFTHDPVKQRLDHSIAAIERGAESFNEKEARGDLFATAWSMFMANPINGVGFRNFRYVYNDFVASDAEYRTAQDPETGKYIGHAHAHSVFLTFTAEMGLIGFVGYVILLIGGLVGLVLAVKAQLWFSAAWWSSFVSSIFPLNSTLDIGASSYGIVVWYLLAMAIATFHLGHTLEQRNAVA